ncbi:MAG TPA: type II secretion system F family protein [Candidatus Saccharimonadales bacterium]|nr:type II secretion system F family protein [Candidatus Saccharimonadales bacterium]
MPDFNFTARQASGQIQKGTISAHSKAAAIAALRAKQLAPIVVKDASKASGLNMSIPFPGAGKVKTKDLVIFTREFATMINAGVPILRALTILKDQCESPTFKKILETVLADVQGGSSMSAALAKHPKAFSAIYVSMVRAGEAGGILDQVLQRLAFQQEKDAALKGKIRAAMIYPIVVFSVTLLAFFILMTFIVPRIGTILRSLSNGKAQLPIYTRALLAISHFMKQPLFILILFVGIPLALVLFRRYTATPQGRYHWHSFILKIPAIKVILIKTAIARFSRVFASLMGAGVSIVDSIDITAAAIGNAVIEKELLDCSRAVEGGAELSTQLSKSKHFPPIVSQMLAVGEETGQTDTVILKIAEFYEEEVDTAVGALSSIIEPVMIIVLGVMVGTVAISVFAPIAQLSTHVAG